MKPAVTVVLLALLLSACSSSDSSADGNASTGGGQNASVTCPDVGGAWRFWVSCIGPGRESDGSFPATVTQSECQVTLTQQDDQTPASWVSSGTLDAAGNLTLTGEFGFTDATTCAVQISENIWSLTCTSERETCTGDAERP